MSTSMFGIGISGLAAAQMGLLATEHNIANANTLGFSRQSTVQATSFSLYSGSGALGQGVDVDTVKRSYDRYLTEAVNNSQARISELDTYYSQISQLDNLVADPNAGLSPALQSFFSGVQQVAANPSSLPARQTMVSSAQTLVSRYQTLNQRLMELSDEVNGRISDTVGLVNDYASQIAELNQQIVIAESSYGQPANDLLDKRDQLVTELNKLVKVNALASSNGNYNVFFASGQPLVVGTQTQQVVAVPAASDSTKIVLGVKNGENSPTMELPESLIKGGQLGGLIAFRNDSLTSASNELGSMAASLALTFNAQLSLGKDLLGQTSFDPDFVSQFFSIAAPKLIPNDLNSMPAVADLAVTFDAPVAPSGPEYSGNFLTNLKATDYQVAFGVGGNFTITRLSDNQLVKNPTTGLTTFSGTGDFVFEGIKLTVNVAGDDGHKFTLKPYSDVTRNMSVDSRIAADVRLIAAASPMGVNPTSTNTGTMKISQGVNGVGYSLANLPVTLTVSDPGATGAATDLDGVPNSWLAYYSDDPLTGIPSTGSVSLTGPGGGSLISLAGDGMSFTVNGAGNLGDQFTIGLNAAGVQDGRNAILLAKLQTQNTMAGGKATYQAAYSQMVASNGIRTREVMVQSEAQAVVLQQAQANRDALSGVNLDEEAANLIKFQQAYQAASKVLEIGNKLFDRILAI